MYYSPAAPLLTLSSSGMPWASYFLQPLASVTKIHAQMSISVGTWSLLPERKTAEWEEKYAPVRSCKHTHKGADMHRLTDYRHRERCLQTYAYVYASHTHMHEQTDVRTNTDVTQWLWTYLHIWRSIFAPKYLRLLSAHGDTCQRSKGAQFCSPSMSSSISANR